MFNLWHLWLKETHTNGKGLATIYYDRLCYSLDEVQALNNKKLSLELGPMFDSSSFSKERLVPFLTLKCFLVGFVGVHFSLVFQFSKPNSTLTHFFKFKNLQAQSKTMSNSMHTLPKRFRHNMSNMNYLFHNFCEVSKQVIFT